ncbi:bestrophin 2 [Cichlidogyrus casuarinus]|uniref:Bestrophin homolog n=1 Tax=Cichlidogyrus casuarinus TaxID=1844966 RepID=A0ABD2PPL4_9PLAT
MRKRYLSIYSLWKLVFTWKLSVFRYLMHEIFVCLVLYYLVAGMFYLLIANDKKLFHTFLAVIDPINDLTQLIPYSFLIGSIITIALGRWWGLVSEFPQLNDAASAVQTFIQAQEENQKTQQMSAIVWDLQHAINRYLNLAWILSLRDISFEINSRFSSTRIHQKKVEHVKDVVQVINRDSVVMATLGHLITASELELMRDIEIKLGSGAALEYWLPLEWALEVCMKAATLGCVSAANLGNLINAIKKLQSRLEFITYASTFNMPLVYPQCTLLLYYGYYFTLIICHQFDRFSISEEEGPRVAGWELLLPIVPFTRVLAWVGTFKMGLSLINPLTEKKGFFPTNEILDRNLRGMNKFRSHSW